MGPTERFISLPVGIELAELDRQDLDRLFLCGHHGEDLGDAEEAGGDGDEADPPLGGFDAEGEAFQAADRIHPHRGEDQADHHQDQGFAAGFPGQVGQQDDPQHRQDEVFRGAEGQGGAGQEGGEELQARSR